MAGRHDQSQATTVPPASPLFTLQVIRRLEAATEEQRLPAEDAELVFVTRLLQLAVGCRGMMRDRQYIFAGGWWWMEIGRRGK